MKYISLIISFVLIILSIYFLSAPQKMGNSALPPLGNFFNPFTGFWQNAEAGPKEIIELQASGLKEEVKIYYDERRVPHIYANSMEDMVFAQGYIIARERLWQMDITVRAVAGRTSEILGERTVEQDKRARRLGMKWAADKAVKKWEEYEPGMAMLQSFSDGINAYVNSLSKADYPLEFKLLNYEPEEWSPLKTALFIKAMCQTLNARNTDIATTNIYNQLGEEAFEDLFPPYIKNQKPIVQENHWENDYISLEDRVIDITNRLIPDSERTEHEVFIGSNSFALGGERTNSGKPILANDPHLGLTLPAIWIEMHLVSPGYNAYGAALTGMPGIAIGFNEHIAWGETNAGLDVFDLYEIKWADETKKAYFLDGEKKETEINIEAFDIKDGATVFDTVLYTYWGPVRKEADGTENLAQRWVTHDPPHPEEPMFFLKLNQATDYQTFREALKLYYAPMQNFIFAARDGDIAIQVVGAYPIKSNAQGMFILDGSTTQNDWDAYIPFAEMPYEHNPERNYVSSANQHSTDPSYPYYYSGGFDAFRGRYINRRLAEMENAGKEDLMNLQLDAYSLKAEEALPILLDNIDISSLSVKELALIDSLKNWDYVYRKESISPTGFDLWWEEFYQKTFDEIYLLREKMNVDLPEQIRLIEIMQENPDHHFFDLKETSIKESLADIATLSFKSLDLDNKNLESWNEHRNSVINHLSMIPAFKRDNIQTDGKSDTPNAISETAGPSWRMVVDLSDPIKAYGIYPGGQSGNPGSPYYDNFIDDWAAGKYYELNYSKDPSTLKVIQNLIIQPK